MAFTVLVLSLFSSLKVLLNTKKATNEEERLLKYFFGVVAL